MTLPLAPTGPDATLSDDAAAGPAAVARALAARGEADVTGLAGAARGLLLRDLLARGEPGLAAVLAVAADEDEADRLARDLAFFLGGRERVARLPADPVLPYDDLSPDRGLEMERLAALCRLHLDAGSLRAVVVSARALARRVVPRRAFDQGEILAAGVSLDREALARRLVELGYARVPLVEDPGTFAVRGGILDLWSPLDERPVRLEFFGDEVESLRRFDSDTQRTSYRGEKAPPNPPLAPAQPPPAGPSLAGPDRGTEVVICPAREALFTAEGKAAAAAAVREAAERVDRPTTKVREILDAIEAGTAFFGMEALLPGFHPGGLATLFDYLPAGTLAWLDDHDAVAQALEDLAADLERDCAAAVRRSDLALPPEAHFLPPAEIASRLGGLPRLRRHRLWMGTGQPVRFDLAETGSLRAEIEGAHGEEGALGPLARRLEDWRTRRIAAVVACGTPSASDRLRRLLEDRRLATRVHPAPPGSLRALYDPAVHVHLVPGDISGGFVDAAGGLALLSDEEIFGRRVRKRPRAARADNAFAAAFRDLEEGDLVVHLEHGIARYGGIARMGESDGGRRDFMLLFYEGNDKLYVPVDRLDLVQRYSGVAHHKAKLDRLGGITWERTQRKVRKAMRDMAEELLALYAARAASSGHAFPADTPWQKEFEDAFPFPLTPDQERAVKDTKADMEKDGPIDRLICGDVGFGKTEVALRAAFVTALTGRQVAVIVPTTLLARQHYATFSKRFAGLPVTVAQASRLVGAKAIAEA
ncbi:MAG TPA: CarD family transcriptional regulator, partial [Anaeromyxobacteraceae bacterium]